MSHYILKGVENALVTYLKAQTLATIDPDSIYGGIENAAHAADQTGLETRVYPCIICVCQSATPATEQATAWLADCYIEVRANASDTTDDEFGSMVDEIMDVINTTTIAADLGAAIAAFTCELMMFAEQEHGIIDRAWYFRQNFQMHCTRKANV